MEVFTKEQNLKENISGCLHRTNLTEDLVRRLKILNNKKFDYDGFKKILGKDFGKILANLTCSLCTKQNLDRVIFIDNDGHCLRICEKCLEKALKLVNRIKR
jgi:hypothetical protein